MDPASFQLHPFGLSNGYVMALIAFLTSVLFVYLFCTARKRGILCIDGKFRPIRYAIAQLRENRNTVLAIVNKDFVGRYNNCYFGVLWNILFPVILVIAIYVIFIGVKGLYTDREYWTYICSGLFIVAICRQALGGYSLRNNGATIRKLPNPIWSIVLADTISSFISCIIPFSILLAFMAVRGDPVGFVSLGYIVLMLLMLFAFCFGLTMVTSIITVLAGDVRQITSTVGRLMVWVSPIFFYICDCTEPLYKLVMCNPFTYIVEPIHQVISYGNTPDLFLIEVAMLCTLFLIGLGFALYLKKGDRIRELI